MKNRNILYYELKRRRFFMERKDFIKLFVTGIFSLLLLFSFTVYAGGIAIAADEPEATGKKAASETTLEKRYDVVLFQKFIVESKVEADYPGAVGECEKSAISELQAKNVFRKVERVEEGAQYDQQTLLVQPKLLTLRIVSGAARFWGGAFAGKSDMIVEIKITDATSGKIVHEKVLSTANNPFAATWTWGSSDRSLPVDMGKIISEYIVSIMPAK
jgi:hypothetical protein